MNYRSYQLLILVGRLGRDARLVETKSGAAMLSFSVATTESVRNADGSYDQRTSWHDCVMFGPRVEGLAGKLVKGLLVSIQARLNYRTVEVGDKTLQTATVVCEDLQMLAASGNAGAEAPELPVKDPAAARPAYRKTPVKGARPGEGNPAQCR